MAAQFHHTHTSRQTRFEQESNTCSSRGFWPVGTSAALGSLQQLPGASAIEFRSPESFALFGPEGESFDASLGESRWSLLHTEGLPTRGQEYCKPSGHSSAVSRGGGECPVESSGLSTHTHFYTFCRSTFVLTSSPSTWRGNVLRPKSVS